jgi:Tol biopolymer transport system component
MLVALVVAALVGCGSSTQTSLTFGPSLGVGAAVGKIVFGGGPWDGNGDLYVMNADGSHVVRLTNTSGIDEDFPVWSFDRTKIAFVSNRDSANYEIHTMNANGSGMHRVTHTGTQKRWFAPSWSPNGKRIAFAGVGPSSWDIYTVNADGGALKRLTPGSGSSCDPSWSPDGTKIAYSSNIDAWLVMQIWVMNADGSNPQRLTTYSGEQQGDRGPDWSPDGTSIVFGRSFGSGNAPDILRMKADGSQVRRLTKTLGECESSPRWSPNGARIAYWNGTGPYLSRIHTMDAHGSNIQVLAGSGKPDDRHEDW